MTLKLTHARVHALRGDGEVGKLLSFKDNHFEAQFTLNGLETPLFFLKLLRAVRF